VASPAVGNSQTSWGRCKSSPAASPYREESLRYSPDRLAAVFGGRNGISTPEQARAVVGGQRQRPFTAASGAAGTSAISSPIRAIPMAVVAMSSLPDKMVARPPAETSGSIWSIILNWLRTEPPRRKSR
jgi:hypothetical protein